MDSNFQIFKTHISEIRPADTVIHHGMIKTVGNSNLSYDSFMGHSLFGDCYRSGRDLVLKIVYRTTKATWIFSKEDTFKLANEIGVWSVYQNNELICGGYPCAEDAIIGLANNKGFISINL